MSFTCQQRATMSRALLVALERAVLDLLGHVLAMVDAASSPRCSDSERALLVSVLAGFRSSVEVRSVVYALVVVCEHPGACTGLALHALDHHAALVQYVCRHRLADRRTALICRVSCLRTAADVLAALAVA